MAGDDVTGAPHVAVVILDWNGLEHTLPCLESLANVEWDELSTIVVDNGSIDHVGDAVRERFPSVQVIRSDRNLGYAGGNNLGLRAAYDSGADYVLLLNNDTELGRRAVAELVAAAEAHPDASAVCPLIYYMDPPDLIWFAGARFDPSRGYNGPHTGYRERDAGRYGGVRETGRATGAAMLVRRRAIEDVGFLDERLFVLVEDVEWSLRMRAAGYRVLVTSAAKVWHRVSAASGGEHSPTIAYYVTRNTLAVSARHAPLRGLRRLRRDLAVLLVAVVHARRASSPRRNLRAVLAAWRDYRAGRLGEWGAGEASGPEAQPSLAADPV